MVCLPFVNTGVKLCKLIKTSHIYFIPFHFIPSHVSNNTDYGSNKQLTKRVLQNTFFRHGCEIVPQRTTKARARPHQRRHVLESAGVVRPICKILNTYITYTTLLTYIHYIYTNVILLCSFFIVFLFLMSAESKHSSSDGSKVKTWLKAHFY